MKEIQLNIVIKSPKHVAYKSLGLGFMKQWIKLASKDGAKETVMEKLMEGMVCW
jgi:hypothetical protein